MKLSSRPDTVCSSAFGKAAVLAAAINATACGNISPAKDPDSLTLQVPLERESAAPAGHRPAGSGASTEAPLIASSGKDIRGICAELEDDNGECSGEVFQNITGDDADDEKFRLLRNRCLALIAECESEGRK